MQPDLPTRARFDDATYEALLRKPWFVPGAHERRDLADDTPYADDYEASLASPDGGDPLAPARGVLTGLMLSVGLVAACLLAVHFIVGWLA